MFVFLLPKTFYDEITVMIQQFSWRRRGKERGICWKQWDKLCWSKWEGLVFWDLEVFNVALLAKQDWHILQNLLSTLAQALRKNYHPSFDFMDTTLAPNA